MTLAEAASFLGIAPNTVRSRWKAGKLRGERDNDLKIWVWIDREKAANDKGSKSPFSKGSKRASKPSIEGFESNAIKALQAHVETLAQQLANANAELAEIRPKAELVTRLEAENSGLRDQLEIRAEQLQELRALLAEAKASHADELKRLMESTAAKGFFARLFGR